MAGAKRKGGLTIILLGLIVLIGLVAAYFLLPGLFKPQADGGDVELVDVSADGLVKVKLTGACHGCPMSQMTLKMGIEKILKKQVPGIKEIISV